MIQLDSLEVLENVMPPIGFEFKYLYEVMDFLLALALDIIMIKLTDYFKGEKSLNLNLNAGFRADSLVCYSLDHADKSTDTGYNFVFILDRLKII